jgi:hypothetical protein
MTPINGATASPTTLAAAAGSGAEPESEWEPNPPRPTISLEPATAYEAVTRQMVVALTEELREIKTRLNGLLFMVAGSLLLEMALRLASATR